MTTVGVIVIVFAILGDVAICHWEAGAIGWLFHFLAILLAVAMAVI